MLQRGKVKRVIKRFHNFTEEERWLQHMLQDGWLLEKYDAEDIDDCLYTFKPVQHEERKKRTYKIDYRPFNKKDDFQEYKTIFEDAGWTVLSNSHWYSKHIAYTDQPNAADSIFSDSDSYKAREKRKMKACLLGLAGGLVLCVLSSILYHFYRYSFFLGGQIFPLFLAGNCLWSYYKHRKVYKAFA